ncbi:hypothetical protein BDN72DRAFT_832546 [Pluteus cervinus]|uniref:Uncharacterized protein n=1 Tax=Pluteus cervinus TaxID=181527 RepID=A0ACD3BAT5_9AGAR|nr:hypothetical protein BDN72DRAFT_832546 [Pluteus cervinus]
MTSNSSTLISVFNVFSVLGIFLTSATLIPVLCFRVRRRPAWISQMVFWLVYSISYFLLLGRQIGQAPPFGLCILQAALIYASPASCAFGVTCFMVDFYMAWRSVLTGYKTPTRFVNFIATIPAIVHVLLFCVVLLLVNDPATVQREEMGFYCHTTDGVASAITIFIVLGAAFILLPIEIWTGVSLYQHWKAFRRLEREGGPFSLSVYIRMISFSVFTGFGLGLGLFIIPRLTSEADPRWSALLPTLPVLASLAFGTQRDILAVYMFWKWSPRSPPPVPLKKDELVGLYPHDQRPSFFVCQEVESNERLVC